jgi:hypothetical protein
MKYFTPVILVLLLLFLVTSCENNANTETLNTQVQDNDTHYGTDLKALPELSETAKAETVSWSVFEDFEANALRLKDQTLPSLQSISEQLRLQADSLLIKIPDTLNTRTIYARLILANTRAKLLEQIVKDTNVDSLQLETSLKEMNLAVQNLFIELNRTFRKSKIDEELKETEKKELEKQKKFVDSVYKSELKDNNL